MPGISLYSGNTHVADTLTQDFDSIADFSLDFQPWITIDVDQKSTYGIQNHSFPHMEDPMAFICFNPAEVIPSMSSDPAIQPHSGSKFAACFSSNPPSNDDWLISPRIQLEMNGEFSFWVKAYTDQYGPELFRVAVSVSDSAPASFTVISGIQPLQASLNWAKKIFNLSAYSNQKVYLAIQCVTNDGFILMIDDIRIITEGSMIPGADFTADKTHIITGEAINFYDQSSGAPSAWQWHFEGGTPDSSYVQNPVNIKYNAPGTYDVTLKVTNQFGSSTLTKPDFITVAGYPSNVSLDFENLEDFTLDFSPWTLIDVRGGETYGIQGITYPHKYDPKAYICFNPSATVPPEPFMLPHTGVKLGCCFSSAYPMNPNDKWLISPKISLGDEPKLEFWIMTYNTVYGLERFNVGVSVSDTNPSSFQLITPSPEAAPAVWTRKTYMLDNYIGQDIFFGIQCVSNDQFIFMIDDIELTSIVGIREQEHQHHLTLYPNPARGTLFIRFHDPLPELCDITIFDCLGAARLQETIKVSRDPARIDLSSCSPGIYTIRLRMDTENQFRKITILD